MKKSTVITLKYIIVWLAFSILYFFLSEFVTQKIFPGFDTVELWVIVLVCGQGFIFLVFLSFLILKLWRLNKKPTM